MHYPLVCRAGHMQAVKPLDRTFRVSKNSLHYHQPSSDKFQISSQPLYFSVMQKCRVFTYLQAWQRPLLLAL